MEGLLLPSASSPSRFGLLAGAGRFPVTVAETARRQGKSVYCVGVQGMAPPELADLCDGFVTAPLARLGRAIRLFRKARCDQVVMAGKIEKTVLFDPFRVLRLLPDWRTIHMWLCYASRDKKDDTILMAVIKEFARDGITVSSALEICPELLVKHGFLTSRKPSATQWKDIACGFELAKEMGRLDIGQSVVIKETVPIAIEAIEGTDRAIRRAGELCRGGGFTVVKVAKPQQDMRFDVPTIGLQTINTMHESGGKVLAIESDKTIVLDQSEVVRLANKLGIVIVAVNALDLEQRAAA